MNKEIAHFALETAIKMALREQEYHTEKVLKGLFHC